MFQLDQIRHRYGQQVVLDLPYFAGHQGEHHLVLGLSGGGKTTLLHVMAGLLRPTEGAVHIAGQDLARLSGDALDRFRGRTIGIVFQQMHLLATLTVRENLLLAQYMAGLPQRPDRVTDVLGSLDVADKAHAYPSQLSYGQKQRVSIARAVINEPRLILADEPTASLDDLRSRKVLDLLIDQADAYDATLVIATHDQRVKHRFEKRLVLGEAAPSEALVDEAVPASSGIVNRESSLSTPQRAADNGHSS